MRSGWSPIVVIAVTTIAFTAISIYYLSSGVFIIFQNLFYVPIIIACVYYTKKGFAFSVALSVIYLFLIIVFTSDSAVIIQAVETPRPGRLYNADRFIASHCADCPAQTSPASYQNCAAPL